MLLTEALVLTSLTLDKDVQTTRRVLLRSSITAVIGVGTRDVLSASSIPHQLVMHHL